ncbi:hypothetical protein [Frateuria aurantia]|uniref:hypothetical protein n=1 Tax=Frateuria aurantia TaxID=81475 RepID=UPI00059D399B|nr:hypothetical protein [Frateuria aurantia]
MKAIIARLFGGSAAKQEVTIDTGAMVFSTIKRAPSFIDMIVWPDPDGATLEQRAVLRKSISDWQKRSGSSSGFFDICPLNDLVGAFNIPQTPETCESYERLRMIHCVDFKHMDRELFDLIPRLINNVISSGRIPVNSDKPLTP